MEAKYPLPIRITHWIMALLIISLLAVGLIMADMPRENPLRGTLYGLHKSFGVLVFLLCFLRITFRVRLGVPAFPEVVPALDRKFAHMTHYAFYLFMLAMPLSGYLMSNSFGFPVKFFGIELPRLIGPDKTLGHLFGNFHYYAGLTLIAVILLHVAGVVKHRITERINLLQRMI